MSQTLRIIKFLNLITMQIIQQIFAVSNDTKMPITSLVRIWIQNLMFSYQQFLLMYLQSYR